MSDERGFTLVEVLVAFFLLMVGMAGTALMLNTANATTAGTKARSRASRCSARSPRPPARSPTTS